MTPCVGAPIKGGWHVVSVAGRERLGILSEHLFTALGWGTKMAIRSLLPWELERPSAIESRMAYLRLALVQGIGPRLMDALLDHFGTPCDVLKASLRQLGEVERIGPKLAMAIREAAQGDLLERVIEYCQARGTRMVIPSDTEYPRLLKEVPDPPPLLFVKGEFHLQDQLSIAIVGTRHPTHYGIQAATMLARGLSRCGLTIVSGLARGIDGVAHRTALENEGRTIAVLGSSVDEIYPPEHEELAQSITKQGVLLSETQPFSKPRAGVFPQRNRLISGLSLGVVVVEAADRSGTLITAGHAGEQGRDLFAVPGPITSRMSRGSNRLIRDGAILIRDAQDVIDHLGPLISTAKLAEDKTVCHPAELLLNDQEQCVLQAIGQEPTDVDEIVIKSGLPVSRVLGTITVLEMRGMVSRISGRQLIRRS